MGKTFYTSATLGYAFDFKGCYATPQNNDVYWNSETTSANYNEAVGTVGGTVYYRVTVSAFAQTAAECKAMAT